MSVKRYGPAYLRDCDGDWFTTGNKEKPNGELVRYDDYAALEAKYNALRDAAKPVVEWWKNDGPFLRINTAAQLDALAALVGEE